MNKEELVDKIVREWSFRCEKGYPDLNNEQDLKVFEEIYGQKAYTYIFEDNIKFKPLTFNDLTKTGRSARLEILANKVDKNDPFDTVYGSSVKLEFINDELKNLFLNRDVEQLKDLIPRNKRNSVKLFIDKDGKEYSFSELLKTKDFGGRGKGSGTRVEDANLTLLNQKISNLIQESGKDFIRVYIPGQKSYEIIGAETQKGTPKSDFNLLDKTKKPVIFISHKKGKENNPSPLNFIRWSGYTKYKNHPQVKKFNKALIQTINEHPEWKGTLPSSTRFISPVEDENLIRLLIYGKNFGSGSFNKNNINIIIQGEVLLNKVEEGLFELSGTKTFIPPEIPTGGYYPYLCSHFRSDRNMFGIPTNEAIVMTKSVAYKASNLYLLKNSVFKKIK